MSMILQLARPRGQSLPTIWMVGPLLESAFAAVMMARIALGPISVFNPRALWIVGAAIFAAVYLSMALWSVSLVPRRASRDVRQSTLFAWLTLPFLALFALGAVLVTLSPGFADRLAQYSSPIQPFPAMAMGLLILATLLAKMVILSLPSAPLPGMKSEMWNGAAKIAVPLTMLIVGILQASVYVIPIGNAFMRFWAIADAVTIGTVYPVTLTEDGPISAGSPIYVYDLALFPLFLKAAFAALGHNSVAAHLPPAIASALFPLSLYLLLAEATGSRVVAIIFAMMTSLFPYFRFWVLNLPDPDPLLLTSMGFAGYFYLRALAWPERMRRWVIAGLASGILSLARPEGILYAGCLALAIIAARPGIKKVGTFLTILAAFVIPMAAVWMQNFGFIWPQNYNKTLRLDYPLVNYEILKTSDALGFYYRGLGLDGQSAVVVLLLVGASILFGTLVILFKNWRLLPMVIPGIGNTVLIFFANPYIPNTYHFADFFRHASFGIPFLALASAYGFQELRRLMDSRGASRAIAYLCLFILMAVVVREGDILANPTATHRQGGTQVLTAFTYLSLDSVARNPLPLPTMEYHWNGDANVARLDSIKWPDASFDFYAPMDMSFDGKGRPFGYASIVGFLVALGYAFGSERASRYQTAIYRK